MSLTPLRWCLPVILLMITAMPGSAAIRLGQPQSVSGEIDLSRIPNSRTTAFLRVRPAAWNQFLVNSARGSLTQNPPSIAILEYLSRSMDFAMAAIFRICFAPVVDEFLVAKWPSRHTWDVEQPVWMFGLELMDHKAVDLLANDMIASCSPSRGMVSERRLRGFPLTSLILPGRQIHLLKGERHLLISPNLFLIQGYLESLDIPPEPPSAHQPDAIIGWRPEVASPERGRRPGDTPEHFFRRIGIERIEISLQKLPMGLEVRFKAKNLIPWAGESPFRPINPDLLDSIPLNPDLVVVGGGLDLIKEMQVDPGTVDRPFAVGVKVPEGKGNQPTLWKVGGAVERKVAVANAPAPVSEELSQRLGGLLDNLGQLGEDLNSRVVEDRILFGDTPKESSPPPDAEQLKEHFTELARETILAGLISPDLLLIPLRWDVLLAGENDEDDMDWLQMNWDKEIAPIEFSLNRPRDGYEIRLISASPISYMMLLADLLFFLQLDYAGEWESLVSLWRNGNPSAPSTNAAR